MKRSNPFCRFLLRRILDRVFSCPRPLDDHSMFWENMIRAGLLTLLSAASANSATCNFRHKVGLEPTCKLICVKYLWISLLKNWIYYTVPFALLPRSTIPCNDELERRWPLHYFTTGTSNPSKVVSETTIYKHLAPYLIRFGPVSLRWHIIKICVNEEL